MKPTKMRNVLVDDLKLPVFVSEVRKEEAKEKDEGDSKWMQREREKKEKMKSKEHIKISLFTVIQQIPIFLKAEH